MKCSVVINTYNRAEPLEAVIEDLCDQDYDDFEIIIVNGPSTDGTDALLERLSSNIKIIKCEEPNLCVSRNLGLKHCAGEIAIFIDDDAIPEKRNWITQYVEAFSNPENKNCAIIGSSVKNRYTESYEFQKGYASRYGFQLFSHEELKNQKHRDDWFERVIGCNNAMHVGKIRTIGGFDENYSYYADETDLCIRALESGYDIKNIPDNTVRHFKHASDIRTCNHSIRWDIIARSDTYYCLKNAKDMIPVRILKTFYHAWKKHYIPEIFSIWKEDEACLKTKVRQCFRLLKGISQGYLLAAKKRKFGLKENPSHLNFKQFDKEKTKQDILSQKTILGNEIRLCRFFWENRLYPNHELFQVYFNSDNSGWSEEKTCYIYFKKNEEVTISLNVPTNGQIVELRLDPSRTPGILTIESFEILIDGVRSEKELLSQSKFDDLDKISHDKNQLPLKFKIQNTDPKFFLPQLTGVNKSIQIEMKLSFSEELNEST